MTNRAASLARHLTESGWPEPRIGSVGDGVTELAWAWGPNDKSGAAIYLDEVTGKVTAGITHCNTAHAILTLDVTADNPAEIARAVEPYRQVIADIADKAR